jgi:hypothetical protein
VAAIVPIYLDFPKDGLVNPVLRLGFRSSELPDASAGNGGSARFAGRALD